MDFLDELHRAEIGPIVALQGLPGWLEPVMWLVSLVGTDAMVLVLLSAVYWCLSPRLGLRIGLAVMFSATVNAVAKLIFHEPRPPWIDARVQVLFGEGSFGLPSGHAQTVVVVAGVVAMAFPRRAVRWAALAVVAVVSLSRVYLGAHFISDVVAGWLLGLAVLALYVAAAGPVATWWRGRSPAAQVLLSAGVAGTLLGAGLLAALVHEGWSEPAAWLAGGARDPASLDRLCAMSGALFGALVGTSAVDRLGWFAAAGPPWARVLRWTLGMGVAGALWLVGRVLGDSIAADLLRYAVVGVWVTAGAPLVFVRLGLAGVPPAPVRRPG
ncbi:phosphatase PAP2 family protein [Streptosporangium soli]|nr:phosphatase PAP2 family protein [Streptosporangium sp. KLBMP 9127]